MVYRGHVENGVVRLDDVPLLPEGAQVEIRVLPDDSHPAPTRKSPAFTRR